MSRGELVLSPKLFERRRTVRRAERQRRRRVVWAVLVLAIAGAGSLIVTRSQFFALTSIEVAGVSIVDEADVIRASGLRIGSNAVAADLEAAAAGVRTLAGVRDARIERVGSLGLMIVVEERRPVLEVRWSGETSYLDREGVVMDAQGRSIDGLPTLAIWGAEAPRTPRPAVSLQDVRGVLTLWRALPVSIRRGIDSFQKGRDGDVRFTAGGTEVTFGALVDVKRKLAAWRVVLERVRRDGSTLTAIDLRVPAHPAARIV